MPVPGFPAARRAPGHLMYRTTPGYNRRVRDSSIRIGTAGWSYPSGPGAWTGIVYPARRGRDKAFDELRAYAEHFDTVEVNSTFYRIPTVDVDPELGGADAVRLRVLGEAVPEAHPSADVPGSPDEAAQRRAQGDGRGEIDAAARPGPGRGRRVVGGRRRVPAGHRSAGLGGQAGRDPGAVPGVVQARRGRRRPPRLADEGAARLPGRRRAAPQDAGATTSRRRCRC